MTHPVTFFAPGHPKGQPRPRAFARKMGGKFVARVYDAGTAEGWKSAVAVAFRNAATCTLPLTGPIRVDLRFVMPRPKSHYRTGKNAGRLRDDAPYWFTGKPDIDNLAKAVFDALTQIGAWDDDSQVVCGWMEKRYAKDEHPGVQVDINQVKP